MVTTTTKWQFTSYERDGEPGNAYAMARYHLSVLHTSFLAQLKPWESFGLPRNQLPWLAPQGPTQPVHNFAVEHLRLIVRQFQERWITHTRHLPQLVE